MIKKLVSFALAVASRGLQNQKTDSFTKQLRYMSCYGNGSIPPCRYLFASKKSNFFYCGKCGCGDASHTWLVKNAGEYSKLDYPRLDCPIKMPGFTNYDPNFYDNCDRQRKKDIENLEPETIQLIQITVNESEEKNKLLDKINNIKRIHK